MIYIAIIDNEIINIVAYDVIADYVYKNINTQNKVMINGCIENNNVKIKKINTIS